MKKYFLHFAVGAVLFNSIVATADNGIQYNYGEFRFILDSEVDDVNIDGDGIAFGGSLRLDELFYVVADYEKLDYDSNIDIDIFQVGVGIIIPYQKVDMFGEAAIVDGDADSGLGGYSDTGFRLSAGARSYVRPDIEIRGTFNHVDLDDTDTYFTLAADYFINKSFSVNASKDLSSELDRFSIGLRYYLGE